MPRKTLRRGIGAKCNIPKRFLHPKRVIDANAIYHNKQDIEGLLIIGREERKINNKQAMCCLFRHASFDDNVILYCVEKFAKVVEEGHEDHYFVHPRSARESAGVPEGVNGGNADAENPNLSDERLAAEREEGAIPFRLTERSVDNSEDIARIRDMGFPVDDDNDPLPENVPENVPQNANATNQSVTNQSVTNQSVTNQGDNSLLSNHHQQWKEDLFVDKAAGSRGLKPSILNVDVKNLTIMEVFLMFLATEC